MYSDRKEELKSSFECKYVGQFDLGEPPPLALPLLCVLFRVWRRR